VESGRTGVKIEKKWGQSGTDIGWGNAEEQNGTMRKGGDCSKSGLRGPC